jgi:threonine synthase
MKLYNINDASETATFAEAAVRGSAGKGGLFMPSRLDPLPDVEKLLAQPFVERSAAIVSHLIGDEFAADEIAGLVREAFSFPCPVRAVTGDAAVLELFHGPTLAFKDFGARFMAQILGAILRARFPGRPLTILTATSGDTGAAVAHAFFGQPNVRVIVLYPEGLISPLQEKLFCTLGGNVTTISVKGSFDDCQALVKNGFADPEVTQNLFLTSANSINFSRLLAQICYYFEAVAGFRTLFPGHSEPPVICVPCGNFGNLTAGLLAQRLGLPVKRFVAATNANTVVPDFLAGQPYQPRPSVPTLANAMDVGAPNNWVRIVELFDRDEDRLRAALKAGTMDDARICREIARLDGMDYLAEPHTAIAWGILRDQLQPREKGVFLATAHPAKFREVVEKTLGRSIVLPEVLARAEKRELLSLKFPAEFGPLKELLLKNSSPACS